MAKNETQNNAPEGVTTRDDAHDLGVPMKVGSPDEPTGPEDALGVGPKRGDYSNRIGPSSYLPHEAVAASREDINDPNKPSSKLEPQRPRVADQGDAPGKGGNNPQK